ncbi:hypothetical protein FB382_004359 [Nocardioides ginsengisegetis]|uniref:Uncharacterized protein n=1 Tax=Nocardioides ginsengisegetis TaxID=661491 RepID=A0A7W3PBS7_9ACTN|nr:hypothetical protein [Nocardioides ginsengisegetis]MBA8805584.1 hypothetical protein [Nocardioides ginsengisegetis]MBA8806008.1 hypothetical protein [Nocardioides ginsengisegetis]
MTAQSDAHLNGDCWPSQCQICQAEEDAREPLSGVYGACAGCGAIEANLVKPTGARDLSAIGEHHAYPTGYGCEFCA